CPILMTFDGNEITVKRLRLKHTLHYVFADLNSNKDTVKILASLNRSYPFATNEDDRRLHKALGEENHEYIKQAVSYIENGDIEELGTLMNKVQRNFDEKVAPMCPDELTAPILHKILADEEIGKYILGGKGVGSQGDGAVQFLAKDEKCQFKLIEYLNNRFHMNAFPLTLKPKQTVTRAIIPVAGLGTRLFPATKAVKKGLMPIMDSDGLLKPLILIIVEQLVNSGITEICLVIGEGDRSCYDALFEPMSAENKSRLSDEKRKYEEHIVKIGKKITYVYQKEPRGFGHAVYQCRDFTKGEPVLLLLGDMIYQSGTSAGCTEQMIDAYEKMGLPIISMKRVPLHDVVHYGIMHGQWDNKEETLLKLDAICEKPTEEYAEDNLNNTRKNLKNNYYAVFGQYILTKEIFETLQYEIDNNMSEHGEIQLTTAIERARQRIGVMGLLINGVSYDTGIPEKYRQTFAEFGVTE
ncbi:MAG: sugar phosphate nucleotidyltransferase, partial [Muribaculaceae bacterium]|nr:sugar phosphate nucleotidyltransferase [Muribaculaceae bacterium]